MTQFDLLIIGAGPAGSFAAELLAKGGAKIALFDGRPPGEPKACGGGVTAKALNAWPNLLNAVGRTIHELDLYSPSGKRLHLKLDEPFAVYSRVAFDGYLRDRARAAGAEVFGEKISARKITKTDKGWLLQSDSNEWTGSVLVGADGANSGIAKMLAGPLEPSDMEVAFGYRAPLPASGDAPTVVAFLPRWVGYAWAFPRPDHISFGIATTQDAFEHQPLDDLLWRFMIGYYLQRAGAKVNFWNAYESSLETRAIREQLNETAERYAARIPGLSATTWDNRKVSGDNWALLGDAAGFADPVTGEGIYYALRSAELFAESYLRGGLSSYESAWRKDFGAELRRAAQMRRRFYGNFWGAPFTERMIEFAKGHRGVRRVLGDLVAGEQGYTDLKKKLAKSALRPLLFVTISLLLLISAQSQARGQRVKQPQEVIDAYRVCNRFQELFVANLDFESAFEATWVKDPKRRREIALAEGQFGEVDLTSVDDATLISAYKSQMQMAFLVLLVLDPDEKKPSPQLGAILEHNYPSSAAEFPAFAQQLKRNAVDLRSYLDDLVARDPKAAEQLREFKASLSKPIQVPTSYLVQPLTHYSRGRVLGLKEEYYQIGSFYVTREGPEMKIIGFRFFTYF
ncbi:MAG TPA: NAD(P)/FAD-dependent oxidoreductase [Pyrinomonadaceae bacterium]|nr:NAD(P)/FAD-dependent oxidoreductase [Pyrinomonadaceae bacterium]